MTPFAHTLVALVGWTCLLVGFLAGCAWTGSRRDRREARVEAYWRSHALAQRVVKRRRLVLLGGRGA